MSFIEIAVGLIGATSFVVNIIQFLMGRNYIKDSQVHIQIAFDQFEHITRLLNRLYKAIDYNDYNIIDGRLNEIRGISKGEVTRINLYSENKLGVRLNSSEEFLKEEANINE